MAETKQIKYSFIIPVVSETFHLKNLLESIGIQKFDNNQFEFIFVITENVNFDEVEQLISSFRNNRPDIRVQLLSFEGKALLEARNYGITHAEGDILIFVEDDIIFEKDYFKFLVEDTRNLQGAFAGGGKIIPVFEQQKPPWMIKFFMPLLAEVNLKEKYKIFPKKLYPFGINMLVHKEILQHTGVFDPTPETNHGPEHIMTSEKQFIDKVRKAGFPVYYFGNLLVWNYIPAEQATRSYIRKQAEIHLQVEIENAKEKGKIKFGRFLVKELLKFIGAIGIGLYYLLTTQWEKLRSLFQYRYWSYKIIAKNIR